MNCRMCLQKSEFSLHIYGENSAKFPIASTIARHFWFVVTEDDSFSTIICLCCWSKIEGFHEYYVSVEEAQRKLSENTIKSEAELIDIRKESNSPYVPQDNEDKKLEKENVENDVSKIESIEKDNASSATKEKDDGDFLVDDDSQDADYEAEDGFNTSDDEPLANTKSEVTNERPTGSNNNVKEIPSPYENKNEVTTNKQEPNKKPKGKSRRILNPKFEEIAKRISVSCDMCTSTFDTFTEMKYHCTAVHKVMGYTVCCSSKFHRRGKYLEHMIRHIAPEMLTCDKCGQFCASERNLRDHTRLRHDTDSAKPYQCDQCPKRFLKPFALKQHNKFSHAKSDAAFKCDDCGKCFRLEKALKIHKLRVHEKSHRCVCDICAQVFASMAVFKQHRLQHDGIIEPRVQCDECGAWLKNKRILKHHKNLHKRTKENIIECDQCGKRSATKNSLRAHIRFVHLKERPYKCSLCDKTFIKRIKLKEHMAIHAGEVLYTCAHCPKTFESRGGMNTHIKNKHAKVWKEENAKRENRQ